ncbi:MAG: hypothetical protein ACK4NM_07115 [Hydrogenophaga sp.]
MNTRKRIGLEMRQNSPDIKKTREIAFVRIAREALPEVWPDELGVEVPSESPDVVLESGALSVGIEVTELVNETVKNGEARRRKVCTRARNIANLGLGIDVAVLFRREVDLARPAEREEAAKLISSLVLQHAAGRAGEDWRVRVDCWGTPLWTYVSTVFVHYIEGWQFERWHSAEAWPVGSLDPARLRKAIHGKEPRLSAYRQKTSTVYLLIVAEGFTGSTAVHIPTHTLDATYSTDFDGVVLLDRAMGQAHLLATTRPTSSATT